MRRWTRTVFDDFVVGTTNVYTPVSISAYDFSLTTGSRITSRGSFIGTPPSAASMNESRSATLARSPSARSRQLLSRRGLRGRR